MRLEAHGGECCGIMHLYGFGGPATLYSHYKNGGYIRTPYLERFKELIAGVTRGRLVEVSLTDSQMNQWAPHLKEAGFKITSRFRNGNSGNYVTVLHRCTSRARKAPTYTW